MAFSGDLFKDLSYMRAQLKSDFNDGRKTPEQQKIYNVVFKMLDEIELAYITKDKQHSNNTDKQDNIAWYDKVTSDEAIIEYSSKHEPWCDNVGQDVIPQVGDTPGKLVNRLYIACQHLNQSYEVVNSKKVQMESVTAYVSSLHDKIDELRSTVTLQNNIIRHRETKIKDLEKMHIDRGLKVLQEENNELRKKLGLQTLPYQYSNEKMYNNSTQSIIDRLN